MRYLIYYFQQLRVWNLLYRFEYIQHVKTFKSYSVWCDRSSQLKMIKPVWSWSDFFQKNKVSFLI